MPTFTYISQDFAKPVIDVNGCLCIEWCGKVLIVVGVMEHGGWVCLNDFTF